MGTAKPGAAGQKETPMSAPSWRPDPTAADRLLRRVRRALAPLAPALRVAAAPAVSGAPHVVTTVSLPAQAWARLDALLHEGLEPYPLRVVAGELVLAGSSRAPLVFSLGHHESMIFVAEAVATLRRAYAAEAARAVRPEPCGCGGALELPFGASEQLWVLPPDPEGDGLFRLAVEANEAAVPVTRLVLHDQEASAAVRLLRAKGRGAAREARYDAGAGAAPTEASR